MLGTILPVVLLAIVAFPAPPVAPAEKGAIGLRLMVLDGRLLITNALKDGPGRKAGVRDGDQILKANDVTVKAFADDADLQAIIKEVTRHGPGRMVVLRVKRGGEERSIEVILGKYATLFPENERNPVPPQ